MTPDQMAELAARLRFVKHTADWIACDEAADLIESMAQRVPLSDADVEALAFRADTQGGGEGWAIYFARLIEQAHGIRSEK